jgi:hypothetical protein
VVCDDWFDTWKINVNECGSIAAERMGCPSILKDGVSFNLESGLKVHQN